MSAHETSRRAVLAALAALLGAGACSSNGETVVLIGGEKIDPAAIDRDPFTMLPGGIIVYGFLDASSMFQTSLGTEIGRLTQNLIPLGPEANFVPSRDVTTLAGGLYAMQGVDFCAVAQGRFDVDAIRRAADARTAAPGGVPLVKTRYADQEMFTAGNVGFTVLTPHTLLTGNETGMRRALDRLRWAKLERAIPQWMADLAAMNRNASFVLAGDFTGQVPLEPMVQSAPFLAGLKKMRVLGNFKPPGINLAGTLTYGDDAAAQAGAGHLANISNLTNLISLLSSLGFGQRIPPMQVAPQGPDVAFTLPMDDRILLFLIRLAVSATDPSHFGSVRR